MQRPPRFNRALIVEDDDRLRRSIARLARDWSEEVLEARTVAEATSMLESSPDLIVIDVRLPDASGLEVAELAARQKPAPAMIAISGKASASEAFGMARQGVHMFLSKPFSADEFRRMVRSLLATSKPPPPLLSDGAALDESLQGIRDQGLAAAQLREFAHQYRLSPREITLAQLVLCGIPRGRFASVLGVSENTCKTMVRRLLHKCDANHLTDIPRILLVRSEDV